MEKHLDMDTIWETIQREAQEVSDSEGALKLFLKAHILQHKNLREAISFILAEKLETATVSSQEFIKICEKVFDNDELICAMKHDIKAIYKRDPAVEKVMTPLLYFKGFHALQGYRVANSLWKEGRREIALFMQNRISEVFAVDIHPAATIGKGVLIDHATGVVIGETALVEDNVSMLHQVTLGGTGKEGGDRHPKVKSGVLIGAGTKILGNITIGKSSKIGAGSVILKDIEEHTTVVGVPGKVVGHPTCKTPAKQMNQCIES